MNIDSVITCYSCKYCNKGFSKLSPQIIDARLCTGEKPCECSNCEKCFVSTSHLVISENHTLEKNIIIASFAMRGLGDNYILEHYR